MPSNKKLSKKGNCFICDKPNVPLCRHCSSVYVCKFHFSSHHQNDYCFPFKIGKKGTVYIIDSKTQKYSRLRCLLPLVMSRWVILKDEFELEFSNSSEPEL